MNEALESLQDDKVAAFPVFAVQTSLNAVKEPNKSVGLLQASAELPRYIFTTAPSTEIL